jgi:hypothetical protein
VHKGKTFNLCAICALEAIKKLLELPDEEQQTCRNIVEAKDVTV